MNKRKAKKQRKKHEIFLNSYVSSYREERKLTRQYHEYILRIKGIPKSIAKDVHISEMIWDATKCWYWNNV